MLCRVARLCGRLTPREVDVLDGLSRGLTNELIAVELGLTSGTVRNHLSSCYLKLGVRGRLEAALLWAGQHDRRRNGCGEACDSDDATCPDGRGQASREWDGTWSGQL